MGETLNSTNTRQRVGVIGGGQLALMLGQAAQKMGIQLVVQTPHSTDPAVAIAAQTILAEIDNADATAKLAQQCDVITFENEFVDLAALTPLADKGICFRPSLKTLQPLLDKLDQRLTFQALRLPIPHFCSVAGLTDWSNTAQWCQQVGFPVVLKARRHGYDGQGTVVIPTLEILHQTLGRWHNTPALLEAFIPFQQELAVMAARSVTGEIAIYPIVETQQENQICHRVIAPICLQPNLEEQIRAIARTLLTQLDVVGILGIELFLTKTGQVLINEIAPRTHNSGHYTIDACYTSQFEQHLRAVCGLSLGIADLQVSGALMVNLLGYESSEHNYQTKRDRLAKLSDTYVHWYNKASRPGRKLGHVTALLSEADIVDHTWGAIAQRIEAIWHHDD